MFQVEQRLIVLGFYQVTHYFLEVWFKLAANIGNNCNNANKNNFFVCILFNGVAECDASWLLLWIFLQIVRSAKRLFVLLQRLIQKAPVVQWIEYRIPVPTIWVRFSSGVQMLMVKYLKIRYLTIFNFVNWRVFGVFLEIDWI